MHADAFLVRGRRRHTRLLRERAGWQEKHDALQAALDALPSDTTPPLMRLFDLASARKHLRKIDDELADLQRLLPEQPGR